MTVYEVRKIYNNGGIYEDEIHTKDTVAICSTRQRAEEWIAGYVPKIKGLKISPEPKMMTTATPKVW